MTSRLWPVLLALAAISFVVLLPRLQVRSRRLFLLRVLFPSWRFFENIGVNSKLQVRWREASGAWGEWRDGLRPPPRAWSAVFHNPRGNLHFARQSAVEHLVAEAEQGGALSESVAYTVVARLAQESVLESAMHAGVEEFQFKIQHCDARDGSCEDFLVSSVHRIASQVVEAEA
jgi:hypothetical protein